MNVGLTFQFTKNCKVFRATPDDFEGEQQVNVNFYPAEDGRTTVTLFAPDMATADALVDAIAACGATKTTREENMGVIL